MRSGPVATCGPTARGRSRLRAWGPGPDPGGGPAHPSAGNQRAWDFVVCTDPEQLAQLAGVSEAAGHVAGSAVTIALVAPSSDDAQLRDLIQFDLGQATMSVMLAAADLGIGSAHAGVHDQELARRLLGVPEDRFCAVLITLGTPADRPLTRSSGPPGARSTRSCTAASGSGSHLCGRCRPGRRHSTPGAAAVHVGAAQPLPAAGEHVPDDRAGVE